MNDSRLVDRRILGSTALVGSILLLQGCHLVVDPFVDELGVQPPVATPSVVAVQGAQAEPAVTRRPHAEAYVTVVNPTITHGPLYFEDPHEHDGSADNEFAWAAVDYVAWFGGAARYLVNAALFPVSAAVTPPWTITTTGHELR